MDCGKMTPKERILTALRHETPDKIPFSMGFGVNEYARKQLSKHLNKTMEEIGQMLLSTSDLRRVSPRYIGPSYRDGGNLSTVKPDIWGVSRKNVYNGFDSYPEICSYPLHGLGETISLEDHEFPSPDWFDYNSLNESITRADPEDKYAITMGNANIFEHSWYMVGFEEMLTLTLTEPEIVYQLLEKVTDFYIAFFERALTAVDGRIDIAITAGDLGHQDGLLISPSLWEKMLKPHHVRLNQMLHSYGVKIMYHTDGAVMEVINGLVDMGIDILEAIQFDAKGMDPDILKQKWGDRLCFHGGVSVQSTLPFGKPEDVHKEVRQRIEVMGENGGYILAPSHAIQGGTPPENIIAFLEEAGRF
jgi:uroporphyrinogen decarboxylase